MIDAIKLAKDYCSVVRIDGCNNYEFSEEDFLKFNEAIKEALQKEFWEACKPYGKVGECVFLTYKIQKKRSLKA
jgi:hypothetical protein